MLVLAFEFSNDFHETANAMAGSGAGVQRQAVWQIIIACVATLPATIVLCGVLFWLFSGR